MVVALSARTAPGKLIEFITIPIIFPSVLMANVFPIVEGPIKFGFETVIAPIFDDIIGAVDTSVLLITNLVTVCFGDIV